MGHQGAPQLTICSSAPRKHLKLFLFLKFSSSSGTMEKRSKGFGMQWTRRKFEFQLVSWLPFSVILKHIIPFYTFYT